MGQEGFVDLIGGGLVFWGGGRADAEYLLFQVEDLEKLAPQLLLDF